LTIIPLERLVVSLRYSPEIPNVGFAPGQPGRLKLDESMEPKETPMEKPARDMFDPKNFLAKVGTGKTILEFQRNQHVFEQGELADTVFYIQKGKVKLTVVSDQGKEAVVAITVMRFASQPRQRWKIA
jgi:CRP-like cAMP-binding protein